MSDHIQPTVIEVAAALVFRSGKLLITQRHPEAHLGGLWEFPGGKREPNESFENCLVRELREELAIDVIPRELIEALTHAYPEKTVHLRFYRCQWKAGEPQTVGCMSLAWITAAELGHYAFPAADARLLDRLRRERELWTRP